MPETAGFPAAHKIGQLAKRMESGKDRWKTNGKNLTEIVNEDFYKHASNTALFN